MNLCRILIHTIPRFCHAKLWGYMLPKRHMEQRGIWQSFLDESMVNVVIQIGTGMSMELSSYLVSWVVAYLGDFQPTYIGLTIYLLSSMDILVL